jgi:hypothetical protein
VSLSPEREQQIRAAVVEKLTVSALDCSWDCPEDCRTHHPFISVSGWAPVDEPEDVDGGIEAIAHVAALAVLPILAEVRSSALLEAAAFVDNDDDCRCGGCDTCQPRKLAEALRQMAEAPAGGGAQ